MEAGNHSGDSDSGNFYASLMEDGSEGIFCIMGLAREYGMIVRQQSTIKGAHRGRPAEIGENECMNDQRDGDDVE